MRPTPRTAVRRRLGLLGVPALGLLLAVTLVPASGEESTSPRPDPDTFTWSFQGEGDERVESADFRDGRIAATAAQKSAARALGATSARWNQFGTPHVLFNHRGSLSGPRKGSAVRVARSFVAANETLFKLSAGEVAALKVLTDSPLLEAPDLARQRDGERLRNPDVAHVVTFRQTFGGLDAGNDGLLTVGVDRDGRVVWVSSSVTGDETVAGSQALDAAAAIRAAAQDVGLDLGSLSPVDVKSPWTTFKATRSRDLQRARLMALPTPDGVRRVWETTVLKADHTDDTGVGHPQAFISFVDAETGKIWLRDNRVDHLADNLRLPAAEPTAQAFSGATDDAGACTPDPHGPFAVGEGNGQIEVAALTTVPNGADDDIIINLYYQSPTGDPVQSQDLLTSPEVLTYRPAGGVPPGDYFVEICEFTPATGSISYEGIFAAGGSESSDGFALPRWRVFESNPNFSDAPRPSADIRELWCWRIESDACDDRQQWNVASRVPWDVNAPSAPSFTTDGNNASTAISEFSFLTPDTAFKRPAANMERTYDYPWENTWFEEKCDPTVFDREPNNNDDDASVTNLFVMHNRMHDWSYFLGFTEFNSNLQKSNFGNTEASRENDPEIGNAQAGRRTVNGRDNANQITLQDGIAPITNQYLWQPLAGAFYAACTDGAYDMAVVAHEYGHAITNRMIAGPDTGTGATQGQTESWSDLIFAEYFRDYGISTGPGANPLALAPYVSGNKERGIRNYAMNRSPLNYSDLEYDGNGTTSPHADGEIWSAVNFDIAQALNRKYDRRFPSSSKILQLRCAKGRFAADKCTGNRRWAEIMFDSFLLMPSGSTMLDSRDAMLAADKLRFNNDNQRELWNAFARRGMGETASSTDANDRQPVPGWTSPLTPREARVTFRSDVKGWKVYTGVYEARISPTADTDRNTEVGRRVEFVPGKYRFIAQAPGYGAVRFTRKLRPGQELVVKVPFRRNLASTHAGATATGDGVNVDSLIDDTEATNWASLQHTEATQDKGEGRQVEGRQVTVDLAGGAQRIDRVQVSAALRPANPEDEGGDTRGQSRFSALRSFDILVCNARRGSCSDADDFRVAYRSADDAFPGVRPRPTAPDLTLRTFRFDRVKATHVRIQVRDNQCTGGPAYQEATNPDDDPAFNPDCDTAELTPDRALLNPPEDQVRIAELQVFAAR